MLVGSDTETHAKHLSYAARTSSYKATKQHFISFPCLLKIISKYGQNNDYTEKKSFYLETLQAPGVLSYAKLSHNCLYCDHNNRLPKRDL